LIPPNIVSQLGYTDHGPPAKQIWLIQESIHTMFDDPVTHSILLAFMAQGSSVDPNHHLSLSALDDHLVTLNAIIDSQDSIVDTTSH